MMVTETGMIYLFRTMYARECPDNDTYSSDGFVEVFSFYNGKISQLFPISYFNFIFKIYFSGINIRFNFIKNKRPICFLLINIYLRYFDQQDL